MNTATAGGVPVIFRPHPGALGRAVITLPEQVASALGLRTGMTLTLRLHKASLPLRCEVAAGAHGNDVLLPRRALALLRIPAGIPLRMQPADDGTLNVGPLVGILSPPRLARNPYQEQTSFFRRLLSYAHRHHIGVYVFSPREINWRTRTVHGWDYLPQRGWVQRAYPFPHVVYDRSQLSASVRAAQKRFQALGYPLFNSLIGSKWWQYRVLQRDPFTRQYLPETRRVRSARDLAALLNRYRSVYIKAAHGGKGMGIWQVSRLPDGRYLVRHTDRLCRVSTAITRSLGPVAHAILTSRRQPYVVQARLWLMRWRGRIFDIRVLAQKDGSGQWRITGAGLRIGRPGGIVSNLHGGGQAAAMDRVLPELLRTRTLEDVREEVYKVALRVAEIVDQECDNVGELGIDLALDQNERLWFLEANSRTGRNVFRRLGSPELALAADVRPLQYAVHLAGFSGAAAPRTGARVFTAAGGLRQP